MIYQCPNCLSDFDKGIRFCQKCGFHLETGSTENPVCPECKRSFPPHTKFCTNDGTPLERSAHILDSIYYENGYPKASLGNRFLAALLDGLITAGLTIPAIVFFVMAMNKTENYESDGVIGLFAFAALLYVLPLTYGLIKDGLEGGQSWGKRAVGLMVINLGNNMPCNNLAGNVT
jgi:hypothetical protein